MANLVILVDRVNRKWRARRPYPTGDPLRKWLCGTAARKWTVAGPIVT